MSIALSILQILKAEFFEYSDEFFRCFGYAALFVVVIVEAHTSSCTCIFFFNLYDCSEDTLLGSVDELAKDMGAVSSRVFVYLIDISLYIRI